ncbi:uncharacterized protein TrAFT101_004358 [Trichoderma asperellum]|uniref:ORC1/DEAH AAA+ ATPase domain-containing protein n=1 Tax=Trichoderma asperellum (strain ATCC 204424 / CBS 433.97 / NBRC 101777) TaxID=1042311 RepID=A0A2T3ZMZ5_TRIA4|nr:hypothetical protein M441DRAFT_42008 [Trichoderma asperellum CBS 433.97]PTB46165.1 hypothetical protein M441DRAFT_42008 [Trichoderma asperellum CBS 433.97]UKZ88608.1 hypothetical protein TrAFT101_004358 [Trichoderma asperellum]
MEQSASSPKEAANHQVANSQFGDQNRIHQGNNNTTLNLHLAYRPARTAIRVIPYPRNEDLIHRPDLVDRLNTILPYSSVTSRSAALWGLGGSGKTQIALNYAYQRCADASCSVLWVHADTEATFSQDYKNIARKLQIDKSRLSEEDLLEAVRDGIEALSNWVLILDNADDLKLFGVGKTDQETKALFQYIPHASTGTVLWTTRDAHIRGTLVSQGRSIEVARMRPDEAKQLLMTFWSAKPIREEAEIDSLVEELQMLPLAIMQAGTYMHRTSTTPEEYLSLLAQSKKRWNILKTNDFNRHRRPSVPNNVLETWTISITRIRQESEMTYKTLHVVAYISNENIPHELIKTALNHIDNNLKNDSELLEHEATKIITRLREFSFIGIRQVEDGSRSYEMHKLVQEAVRYGLSMNKSSAISENEIFQDGISEKENGTRTSQHELIDLAGVGDGKHMGSEKYFSSIALQATADLFPESQQNTWKQCEKYLAHALQIGEWADIGEKHIETAELLSRVSDFFEDRGRWNEKERVDEKILEFRQKILGDKHPDTIWTIANLASTYYKQGRYRKAEALEVQVLDNRQEILGDRHPDTIKAMGNLAVTYYDQGRYSEAETLQIQVLDIQREILGDRHPDTIKAMGNLAATYHGQGRRSEGETLEVQVLDIRRKVLGDRHPDTIMAMGNLASTYYKQGRYSEGETLEVQVLDIRQEILGDRHPDTLMAMGNLASTYYKQGRHSEGETLDIQVLDIRQEILGDGHPDTLTAMHNLAWSWYRLDRHQDAIALMQQALQYRLSALGPNHPNTLRSAEALQEFQSSVDKPR